MKNLVNSREQALAKLQAQRDRLEKQLEKKNAEIARIEALLQDAKDKEVKKQSPKVVAAKKSKAKKLNKTDSIIVTAIINLIDMNAPVTFRTIHKEVNRIKDRKIHYSMAFVFKNIIRMCDNGLLERAEETIKLCEEALQDAVIMEIIPLEVKEDKPVQSEVEVEESIDENYICDPTLVYPFPTEQSYDYLEESRRIRNYIPHLPWVRLEQVE